MPYAPKRDKRKDEERETAHYGNYFIQEHQTEAITDTEKIIDSNLGSES
jgi:hypothetical protein